MPWCIISLSLFSLVVCIVEINLDTIFRLYLYVFKYQEYSINSIIATILSRRKSKNKLSLSLSLALSLSSSRKKKSPPSLP